MGHRSSKTKGKPREPDVPLPVPSSPPPNTVSSSRAPVLLSLPDGITIVWLDAKAKSLSQNATSIRSMLERIHSSVIYFDDVEKCCNAVRTIENRNSRLFLVVSGQLSLILLPQRTKLPKIDSIFIFCSRPEKYENLIKDHFPHVIGIYTDEEQLKSCLAIELNRYNVRAPALNFFAQDQKATRDLTYDEASFIWFQLAQRILTQAHYDHKDKEQMVKYSREQFARHVDKQKYFDDIEEFETGWVIPPASYHRYSDFVQTICLLAQFVEVFELIIFHAGRIFR